MAGIATGIGSTIAFFAHRTNEKFFSFALGLSAGVMVYISFMELLFNARIRLVELSGSSGNWTVAISFFAGIIAAGLIDRFIPDAENPHEIHDVEEMCCRHSKQTDSMRRTGIITAIAIAIHNFPEGIATFISAIDSLRIGTAVAIAVAIHNIPEGIAVSVPIFLATGNRKKAFWYSFASGLSEPLGAVFASLLLMPLLNPVVMECTFAAVAGIMIYISFDELLPAAHRYGHNHTAIYGMIFGMAVMAVSLLLLE